LSTAPTGLTTSIPADGIRVVGYLGMKAVIRSNHTTGFAMGIRVIPLTGNGPGRRAVTAVQYLSYVEPIRAGSLWLVADNAVEGGAATAPLGPFTPTKGNPVPPTPYIDASACMRVDNVYS
jgi:hypothetical protein